jgi:nucleoside-diphosphate-sugar epimerase
MRKIIGNGMIAKEMDVPFDVIVFASGVSNSQSTSWSEFEKEINLLFKNTQKDQKLIYFSTVTVHQKQKTPYIAHKEIMEALIRDICPEYLILRLPNLIGPNQNTSQLIPALVKQILNGEVTVQRGAKRCILDVADVPKITNKLLSEKKNGTFDVFGRPILLEDLVHQIANFLRAKPKINLVPPIDYPDLEITIDLEDDYYRRIIKKYLKSA